MSSPSTRSDSRSSPARRTPNGFRRSQTNGYQSPFRHNTESPSRQLVEEFSKVYLDEERIYKQKLDEQSEEQERLHREALSKSLQKHEEVRQSVERAQERLQLELDRVKRERLAQEQATLEKERREAAEAEAAAKQREIDIAKQRELELKQAAAKQKELEDTRNRIEDQKKQVVNNEAKREAERVQKQEAEKKARDDAVAAAKAKASALASTPAPVPAPSTAQPQAQPPAPQPNGVQSNGQVAAPSQAQAPATAPGPTVAAGTGVLIPNGIYTSSDAKEAEHQRYLDLHARLKQMCKDVEAQAKSQGKPFKEQLSNLRREFTKILGQINKVDKAANSQVHVKIRDILTKAMSMVPEGSGASPMMLDISPYLVSVDPAKLQASSNTQYPAILLYLLHHFVKAVSRQMSTEVCRDPEIADPLGILVVTMFAYPAFHFNGIPMTDVLWAKYHKVCPVLFGISGSQQTYQGKKRLGWRMSVIKDDNDQPTNQVDIVSSEEHYDRMMGFGAGFAAITLRDFSKSRNKNPAPNHLFWTALARIINTPGPEQTPTHYVVLNYMLRMQTHRFITFYGGAAIAALRKACIDFPAAAGAPVGQDGKPDPMAQAVKSLPIRFQSDLKLTL